MKKIIGIFLSLSLVIGLSACTSGSTQVQDEQQVEAESNVSDGGSTQSEDTTGLLISNSKKDDDEQQGVNESSQKATPRRAVMVNGVLYLDTGYVSGVGGRCGTLDGNITSVIDKMDIPDEDGEANFEAEGWQVGFEENTIDIPIDNDWYIFGASGTEKGKEGYLPESVLQFMATIEEVNDDENEKYIIVRADFEIQEMFREMIKQGARYRLNLENYEPGIYTDTPVVGNAVLIACSPYILETDPAIIPGVYSISPVGGDVYQKSE